MRDRYRGHLVLGQMLRPVTTEPAIAMARLDTRQYAMEWPEVLTSSWRGTDGSAVVFFVNATEEPQEFTAHFRPEEYGTDVSAFRLERTSSRSDAPLPLRSDASGGFAVHLQPGEIATYRFLPYDRDSQP